MCGIIGVWGNGPVIRDIYQGLLAIQHRGQDSAGVITFDGRFHAKKGNGLVHDIFTPEAVQSLRGPIGLGHTRYPTIGGGSGEDAQPFQLNSPFGLIMAHNGNVANYRELRDELYREHHRLLNSDCDVEIILNFFAESLAREKTRALEPQHVFRAVEAVFRKVRGSYSVVAYVADQGLVAFRDPYGIKPLVAGVRRDGLLPSYAFASETVSLNIMNFGEIRDIEAGEVFIRLHRRPFGASTVPLGLELIEPELFFRFHPPVALEAEQPHVPILMRDRGVKQTDRPRRFRCRPRSNLVFFKETDFDIGMQTQVVSQCGSNNSAANYTYPNFFLHVISPFPSKI